MKLQKCRICNQANLCHFFDLGEQPLANSLVKELSRKEDCYPLSLSWCRECNLVQLNETIHPRKLFSYYVWVTGTSKKANEYAEVFCNELLKRTQHTNEGYVLEVGSNDGVFLKPFIKRGHTVLGIDPAKNIARKANKIGIPTKQWFFKTRWAKQLVKERKHASIIFARNVLPHVANTRDFVEGLALCLADDGTLAIEAHYAKVILEELHYDSIYHEHLCYFSTKTMIYLLEMFNLFVFDIAKSPISGGSLIYYATKKKKKMTTAAVTLINAEEKEKTNYFSSWNKFAQKSSRHRVKFVKMLEKAKNQRKTIVGWGASARSSTLLNFCDIGPETIQLIADKNPLKQGKYTAGIHIPIDSPDKVLATKPDYVVILAWNFAQEIIQELQRKYKFKGYCIIPLPNNPRIVKLS